MNLMVEMCRSIGYLAVQDFKVPRKLTFGGGPCSAYIYRENSFQEEEEKVKFIMIKDVKIL